MLRHFYNNPANASRSLQCYLIAVHRRETITYKKAAKLQSRRRLTSRERLAAPEKWGEPPALVRSRPEQGLGAHGRLGKRSPRDPAVGASPSRGDTACT